MTRGRHVGIVGGGAADDDDAESNSRGNRTSFSPLDRPLDTLLHRTMQAWRRKKGKRSPSKRAEEAFLARKRAEFAALSPDILMRRCREVEAKAFNEFDEGLMEAPLAIMQLKYQADVSKWGRYKDWSVEEAVALYLDRDPNCFKLSELDIVWNKSAILTKAQDFRRLAEDAVQTGALLKRTAPRKLFDWAGGWHHAFPERLIEAVNQYQQEEAPNQRAHELWDRMDTKKRNNLFRLLAAMAIDGYGFDPYRPGSHGSTAMSRSIEAIGFKLSPETITQILQIISDIELDKAVVEECLAERAKRIRAERNRS